MRSEERAGIIAAVLLFLWGLPPAFPLHRFTVLTEQIIDISLGRVFPQIPGFVFAVVSLFFLSLLEILLLLLSKTDAVYYIPASILAVTALFFIALSLKTGVFDRKTGIIFAVLLLITAVLHFMKLESALIWIGDIFIYSLSVHLLVSLVFAPLKDRFQSLSGFLYITRYADTNIASKFNDALSIPSFIWGIFFMILVTLPVVYYSFSRRRGRDYGTA